MLKCSKIFTLIFILAFCACKDSQNNRPFDEPPPPPPSDISLEGGEDGRPENLKETIADVSETIQTGAVQVETGNGEDVPVELTSTDEAPAPPPITPVCSDPDSTTLSDKAQLLTKSATTSSSSSGTNDVEDKCVTVDGKTYLMEGTCNNNEYQGWQYDCTELAQKKGASFVCSDGACVKSDIVEKPPQVSASEILNNVSGKSYFVATPELGGLNSGDGTIEHPLDIKTVLGKNSSVKPGETVWLRGGTYVGNFESYLKGEVGHPIVVRAFPGERPVLDSGGKNNGYTLTVQETGVYTWFWGLEIKLYDNTFVGPMDFASGLYPDNTYYYTTKLNTAKPKGAQIAIVPYDYGEKIGGVTRAHISIYNWDHLDKVLVDEKTLASVLSPGSWFEIRDSQNYFAEPVLKGKYKGGSIELPMAGLNAVKPLGELGPVAAGQEPHNVEFNTFVLLPFVLWEE
jgi:hypothetical protein